MQITTITISSSRKNTTTPTTPATTTGPVFDDWLLDAGSDALVVGSALCVRVCVYVCMHMIITEFLQHTISNPGKILITLSLSFTMTMVKRFAKEKRVMESAHKYMHCILKEPHA